MNVKYLLGGLYIKKQDDKNYYKEIYQLKPIGSNFMLISSNGSNHVIININELERDYVSVRSILDNSEYLGIPCYRTKAIKTEDGYDTAFIPDQLNEYVTINQLELISKYENALNKQYIVDKDYVICLYKTENDMLIYESNKDYEGSHLKFISNKFIDNNWKYEGYFTKLYSDKDEIIRELYANNLNTKKRFR